MATGQNKSIIFHIDVNSAFLSWSALKELEQGNSLDLRTVPSIVGGDSSTRHGVVLAKSIPAKAYGIVTGEPVANAYRKCPNLICVPPDSAWYSEQSHGLMDYLRTICPRIEQVSVDECYMDYTPISGDYPSPVAAATYIKDSVYDRFRFTVNVGISDVKVLAKMASDFKKPNLVHTLFSYEIEQKLWPLPVSDLFLCGKSSVQILHKLGILTIGDLAHADPMVLDAHLKSHGRVLLDYANGRDASVVNMTHAEAKGVGNSTTMTTDAVTREDACKYLLKLSESVSGRLRKAHSKASNICTEIRYNDFRNVSHQKNLSAPSHSTDDIYRAACELFDELWDGTPVRLLGVRATKLSDEDEPVQLSLFDYAAPVNEKKEKLDAALDQIRNKYGKNAIKRGSLIDSPHK